MHRRWDLCSRATWYSKLSGNLKQSKVPLWLLGWCEYLPKRFHVIDICVFRKDPVLLVHYHCWSGNTKVIHPVFERWHFCGSHFCSWLSQHIIIFLDESRHLFLLRKKGNPGCPLCIVCAIEIGNGNCGWPQPVRGSYIEMLRCCSLSDTMGDMILLLSLSQQDVRYSQSLCRHFFMTMITSSGQIHWKY